MNEMMAHLHLTNDPSRVGFYSGLGRERFLYLLPFLDLSVGSSLWCAPAFILSLFRILSNLILPH
jgi:hypothetical protein